MRFISTTALVGSMLAAAGFVGCGSFDSYGSNHSDIMEFTTADQQIAHGAQVYANNCAECHGNSGQGKDKAPMLVGSGALSDFRTALDVAEFVVENMPPEMGSDKAAELYYFPGAPRSNHGGSEPATKLQGHDYWAVLAFALSANGVELSEPVGPHNTESIVLNP